MATNPHLFTLWQRVGGEWRYVHTDDSARIRAAAGKLDEYGRRNGIGGHEVAILRASERPEGYRTDRGPR